MKVALSGDGVQLSADMRPAGPVAVLLHAGGERRQVWDPVAASLSMNGIGSLAVDLRGHGQSQGSRENSIWKFAADVRHVVNDMAGETFLVGASLGGFAALLALADPVVEASVSALVLVDVVPDPEPSRVRRFLSSLSVSLEGPLVEEILAMPEEFIAVARRLRLPVLLVVGGRSAITRHEIDRLRESIPHLRVEVVTDAGHLIARDAPHELAGTLASFLSSDQVRHRHWSGELESI